MAARNQSDLQHAVGSSDYIGMWKTVQGQLPGSMAPVGATGGSSIPTIPSSGQTSQVTDIDFSLLGSTASATSNPMTGLSTQQAPSVSVPMTPLPATVSVGNVGTVVSSSLAPTPNIFETDPFRNL